MNVSKVLVSIALIFTILGCSQNQELNPSNQSVTQNVNTDSNSHTPEPTATPESVPEPLIKAIEKINSGDVETALTYLELTLKDFPESEYVFGAKVLNTYLLLSRFSSGSMLSYAYKTGTEKYMDSAFKDVEGLDQVQSNLNYLHDLTEERKLKLLGHVNEILEGYQSLETLDIANMNISYPQAGSNGKNLSFFSNTGYPPPTRLEVQEAIESYDDQVLSYYSNDIFDGNNVRFLDLIYFIGIALYNYNSDTESKPFLEEIISLTEDDPYNERRIQALKALEIINTIEY